MSDGLQVSPSELQFRFELRKNIPVTLALTNTTGDRLAFKVKTTAPKKYCVRPSSGFVEPTSTKDVQVIMQAQREMPPSFADCKDKFLVQSVKIAADVKELAPDLFDTTKNKDIKQAKLKVVLLGPAKPPSPVPEGVEEPPSPVSVENAASSAPSAVDKGVTSGGASSEKATTLKSLQQERNKLRESLLKADKEKDDIMKKAEVPAAAGRSKEVTITPKGGFSIIHLLLVAIIAFLIGHFT